ncbi:MAG TPA: helix-turn-helix domain-containing GNAT family N-acetyltransferase [Rhodopila sp.]|nr:helix-turn-helix domain-containing GNAT family N-acetyltransferase [Rhodopila sp.]
MSDTIAAIRRFNRFYTRQLGLLDETLLDSGFTLTEARVLYELAHAPGPITAADIGRELVLDAGYLSRILKSFAARGLLERIPAEVDARQTLISLSPAGRAAFAPLNEASQREVGKLIGPLSPLEQADLVAAMRTIRRLLGRTAEPVTFRRLEPGDLGWIARRQTLIYAQEYGWDGSYEALAAEILVSFARAHDPAREKAWIAVRGGAVVGSVFVVRASDTTAKLRLLYVEPEARGLGLGRQLVEACIAFARDAGYRTLTLWTQDVLIPARRIYQQAGFTCTGREPHHSFGHDLVAETWERAL